jgi:gliding motility-associated-like protein
MTQVLLTKKNLYNLLVASCLLLAARLPAQTIPCDGAYYLFLVPSVSTNVTAMYRVTVNETTGKPNFELINPNIPHRIAAVGYSIRDQKIYGLDYNTKRLLRIDALGAVEVFPVPRFLDTTNVFSAGEVNPSGGNLMVVGRNPKTNKDGTIFSIRLNTEEPVAGLLSVLSDFGTTLEDLVFDPLRGTLYGYEGRANKLVWVDNFSGRVSDYFSRNMSGVGILGSLFFNRKGQLQAYGSSGSSEESSFFNINKLQGEADQIDSGPRGRFTDGCGCPFTIRTFKTATPRQVLPCEEITVTYDLINHAGTAYSYISLNDTFPEGFMITNVTKKIRTGEIVSGVGSNILSINAIDLVLDTNRVVITLQVTDAARAGFFANQAVIGDLPLALGKKIYSDDPTTAAKLDATGIEIIGSQNRGKLTQQQPLCDGSGILLKTNLPNATHQWSNGATSASTLITQPGSYAVTVTTDCGSFVDSILVNTLPEKLQVELPPVTTIELGETTNLLPTINTTRPLTFQWQAADSAAVPCSACSTLVSRPVRNTLYTLSVRDANGCTAQATAQVNVLPLRKVYAPTAFSPNGDGVNDVFYLQGKGAAKIVYLRIFDRWGNQVFAVQNGALNEVNSGWNGKNGAAQTYVYVAEIEFLDGVKKRLRGEVALLK